MKRTLIIPQLSRAGLGNELFTFLKAVELLHERGGVLIPPRWFQPRIGPTLRGEHDKRHYWRLFRSAPLQLLLLRAIVESLLRFTGQRFVGPQSRIVLVSGMGAQFEGLRRTGGWHRERLREYARPGIVRQRAPRAFLSMHVRLGDFGRGDGQAGVETRLEGPNTAAPIEWYVHWAQQLRREFPDTPLILSSDGTPEQLAPLLALEGVTRSTAANALDEMFLLSDAAGLLGSRSTFSAWGAFLGHVPMLVPLGGDQYSPHDEVWEAGSAGGRTFLAAVRRRMSA